MQDGGTTDLAKMYGDPNKITRGDVIAAATKNKKQMGSTVARPMGKAVDMQAPSSFMENTNKQKTMMYGGMAAKKKRVPMMMGDKVHGRGYNRSYGFRKPQSV